MIEIIQPSRFVETVYYRRAFVWKNDPGAGFGFPCDEHGNVGEQNPAASENYQKCIDGTYDVIDMGVEKYEESYREPAVGKCICGAHVTLDGFTCPCDECGRDYNSAGQLLAPREQWGEETGEHWSDISRIP